MPIKRAGQIPEKQISVVFKVFCSFFGNIVCVICARTVVAMVPKGAFAGRLTVMREIALSYSAPLKRVRSPDVRLYWQGERWILILESKSTPLITSVASSSGA